MVSAVYLGDRRDHEGAAWNPVPPLVRMLADHSTALPDDPDVLDSA